MQCCVTVEEQQNWTPSELLRIAAGEKVGGPLALRQRWLRLSACLRALLVMLWSLLSHHHWVGSLLLVVFLPSPSLWQP